MRVTITGPDDVTPVSALVELSSEFPFVEWGVLRSPARAGEPRYPSLDWVAQIAQARQSYGIRISLHLCGRASADTKLGKRGEIDYAASAGFQRLQVNGWDPAPRLVEAAWRGGPHSPEIILQARSELDVLHASVHARALPRGSVLFDASGGRGLPLTEYPAPFLGVPLGYAGGIGPDSIRRHLGRIDELCAPNPWVDMESGVRTGDQFDLKKVRAVLEAVRAWEAGGLA